MGDQIAAARREFVQLVRFLAVVGERGTVVENFVIPCSVVSCL